MSTRDGSLAGVSVFLRKKIPETFLCFLVPQNTGYEWLLERRRGPQYSRRFLGPIARFWSFFGRIWGILKQLTRFWAVFKRFKQSYRAFGTIGLVAIVSSTGGPRIPRNKLPVQHIMRLNQIQGTRGEDWDWLGEIEFASSPTQGVGSYFRKLFWNRPFLRIFHAFEYFWRYFSYTNRFWGSKVLFTKERRKTSDTLPYGNYSPYLLS